MTNLYLFTNRVCFLSFRLLQRIEHLILTSTSSSSLERIIDIIISYLGFEELDALVLETLIIYLKSRYPSLRVSNIYFNYLVFYYNSGCFKYYRFKLLQLFYRSAFPGIPPSCDTMCWSWTLFKQYRLCSCKFAFN